VVKREEREKSVEVQHLSTEMWWYPAAGFAARTWAVCWQSELVCKCSQWGSAPRAAPQVCACGYSPLLS